MVVHVIIIAALVGFATEWERVPKTGTPPDPRQRSALHLNNGKLCLIGGRSHGSNFADMWVFDLNGMYWEKIPSGNHEPRDSPATWIDEVGDLHVFSGNDINAGLKDDHIIFDGKLSYWKTAVIETIPPPRWEAAICTVEKDNTFLFGGKGVTSFLNDLWRYSNRNGWELITQINPPPPRRGAVAAYDSNSKKVYIVGGLLEGVHKYDSNIWFFNVSTTTSITWESQIVPDVAMREGHSAVISKSILYVIFGWGLQGNETTSGLLGKVLWCDLSNISKPDSKVIVNGFDLPLSIQFRDYAAVTISNGVIYLFGGWGSDALTNQFISLSTVSRNITVIHDGYVTPVSRAEFASATLRDNIVVHGGMQSHDTRLRSVIKACGLLYLHHDAWRFHIPTLTWYQIQLSSTPSGRYGHSAIRHLGRIFFFGGRDSERDFSDVYILKLTDLKPLIEEVDGQLAWEKVNIQDSNPRPRHFHAAATQDSRRMIVCGGMSISGKKFDDVWSFDLVTLKWTELERRLPKMMAMFSIEFLNQDTDILTVFGTQISEINIRNKTHPTITRQSTFGGITNYGFAKLNNNSFIVVGGEEHAALIRKTTITSEETIVISKQLTRRSGHKVIPHGSIVYTYAGYNAPPRAGKSFTLMHNDIWKLPLSIRFCSPGWFIKDNNCLPCPAGSYSSVFESTNCTLCPAGTYNPLVRQNDKRHCIPCPVNYFTQNLGSIKCLQCSSPGGCLAGSTRDDGSQRVFNSSSKLFIQQPDGADTDRNLLRKISILTTVALIGCLASLVSIFLLFENFRYKFTKFDILFGCSHHQITDTFQRHLKSPQGGLLSICVVAITTVVVGLMLFISIETYLTEDILLSPHTGEKITSDISATLGIVTTYSCRSLCSSVKFTTTGILYTEHSISCSVVNSSVCELKWSCTECEFDVATTYDFTQSAKIIFNLDEDSYASGFIWSVDSTSSYPGKLSRIGNGVTTPTTDFVFKGSKPTVLTFEATLSKWFEVLYEKSNTGMHLSFLTVSRGSEIPVEDINIVGGLSVVVVLLRAEYLCTVVKSIDHLPLFIVTVLFGIFPGVIFTGRVTLQLMERFGFRFGIYHPLYQRTDELNISEPCDDADSNVSETTVAAGSEYPDSVPQKKQYPY